MVKVVSKGYFYEDTIEEALRLYEKLVIATRNERGCIRYNLHRDIDDDSILTMIEEWENEDCLKAHFETEHFKTIVPRISKLRKKADLNKYKVIM